MLSDANVLDDLVTWISFFQWWMDAIVGAVPVLDKVF